MSLLYSFLVTNHLENCTNFYTYQYKFDYLLNSFVTVIYQHEICVHTFHKGTPTVTRNPPWAMWPVLTEAQSSISYHKKSHPRKSQKRVCKSTLGLQTLHFQILNNRANPKIQIKRIEIPTLCSSISLTQNETKLNKIIYQLI